MNPVFTIENMRPIRDGMTVSRDSRLGTVNKITYFSMGAGTSISQESYDRMTMYITDAGSGTFLLGEEPKNVFATPGTALIVPEKTLCGMQTENGLVYTEIIFEKENTYVCTHHDCSAGRRDKDRTGKAGRAHPLRLCPHRPHEG